MLLGLLLLLLLSQYWPEQRRPHAADKVRTEIYLII
jgi:hypothetical protein